jgi:dolichol-phosphate mannosyltransferase
MTMAILERRAVSSQAVELPEPWCSAAVTVVLPTYNEAANLPVIVAALFRLPLPGLRVLVADDNSPDGTGEVAEALARQYGPARMTVVHRPSKQGLGRAYVDGMTRAMQAGAEFVVQMDADLSHSPEYLPQMLGTLLATGADAVLGSRYVAGASLAREWSWHRKALSAFANAYVRLLLRLGIRDVTAGFKLWRGSALHAIDLASIRSNGYSFQVEMNYRTVRSASGLKVVEVPIHFAERSEGESKMSLRVQLESALLPFLIRRRVRAR